MQRYNRNRLEDPRELIELHLQERDELDARTAVIDSLLDALASDGPAERDFYRWQVTEYRRMERKAQRVNGTSLVLNPSTFDREASDEPAEVTDFDLAGLAYHGICIPDSDCVIVTKLDEAEYARRAFWEGF